MGLVGALPSHSQNTPSTLHGHEINWSDATVIDANPLLQQHCNVPGELAHLQTTPPSNRERGTLPPRYYKISTTSDAVYCSMTTPDNPASSCQDIATQHPLASSGYYWVNSSNGTAIQMYCDIMQCLKYWGITAHLGSDKTKIIGSDTFLLTKAQIKRLSGKASCRLGTTAIISGYPVSFIN